MHQILIRDALVDDMDQLLDLLAQLFAIEADFTFDRRVQARGLGLMLDGCGKHRVVKVACLGSRVLGMCTAQTRISTATGSMAAVLEDLVVDRSARGRGIGPKLLEAMTDWARTRGALTLSLLADRNNRKGLAFYFRESWQPTDLVCLTRKIQPPI